MPVIEKGRICYKTRGKNAGKKVVIADNKIEGNKVKVITANGIKKINIRHIFPTEKKIKETEETKTREILR